MNATLMLIVKLLVAVMFLVGDVLEDVIGHPVLLPLLPLLPLFVLLLLPLVFLKMVGVAQELQEIVVLPINVEITSVKHLLPPLLLLLVNFLTEMSVTLPVGQLVLILVVAGVVLLYQRILLLFVPLLLPLVFLKIIGVAQELQEIVVLPINVEITSVKHLLPPLLLLLVALKDNLVLVLAKEIVVLVLFVFLFPEVLFARLHRVLMAIKDVQEIFFRNVRITIGYRLRGVIAAVIMLRKSVSLPVLLILQGALTAKLKKPAFLTVLAGEKSPALMVVVMVFV